MSHAEALTTSNFSAKTANGVSLVDYWAVWCGPCRVAAPIIDELAAEYSGKAHIYKVDVDSEQQLAIDAQVHSIPTFIIYKNGAEVNRFVGVAPDLKTKLKNALDAALSS
jgi:thioredoxin 1